MRSVVPPAPKGGCFNRRTFFWAGRNNRRRGRVVGHVAGRRLHVPLCRFMIFFLYSRPTRPDSARQRNISPGVIPRPQMTTHSLGKKKMKQLQPSASDLVFKRRRRRERRNNNKKNSFFTNTRALPHSRPEKATIIKTK
jgi:hypothetical protein